MNGDAQAGAPLSLAVGGVDELRRRAACGDRGRGAGRDRQPHRPSRARRRGAIRSRCWTRSGPDAIAARICAARRAGGERAARPKQLVAAASRHAGPSRRARRGRRAAAPARRARRRGRARADGLRRIAAGSRRRRAHRARAGAGRRGAARRALPLQRSGALLVRPRRQGSTSVPGADQGLRPDDPRAEVGGRARPSSAATRSWPR